MAGYATFGLVQLPSGVSFEIRTKSVPNMVDECFSHRNEILIMIKECFGIRPNVVKPDGKERVMLHIRAIYELTKNERLRLS